jgi:hypothetical protein
MASVLVLGLPATPAHAAVGVRTTRAIEFAASSAPGVLTWTQAPRSRPGAFRALAKLGGSSPIRLNPRGTTGLVSSGAVDEGGNRIAYWQHRGTKGNIKIFKVDSRTRRSVFVNTAAHEWGASISGKRLLFARGRFGSPMRIYLANLRTRNVRRLARVDSGVFLEPGDLSGRWATWTRCNGFRNCSVTRLNVRTGNSKVMGNPRNRSQFGASVLPNGVVFYGESSNYDTCASRLRLFKVRRGGGRVHLDTLPDGLSIGGTSVRRVSSSAVHLYHDRYRCSTGAWDIYRMRARA